MIRMVLLLFTFLLLCGWTFAFATSDMQHRLSVLLDQWKADNEEMYEKRKRYLRLIIGRRLADPQFARQHAVMLQFRDILDERDDRQSSFSLSGNIQPLCQMDDVRLDLSVIAAAWLDQLNHERRRVGSPAIVLHPQLMQTAGEWACTLRDRFAGRVLRTLWKRWRYSFGSVHMRNQGDRYYDFPTIEMWMRERWVVARNVERITFAESVGAWVVRCPEDCTQAMIDALDQTWTMYMNEKPRRGVHYVQMTRAQFRVLGIGLAYDSTTQAYWVVFHYATELE